MDVRYSQDGTITPIVPHWPEGSALEIANVLDARLATSLKVGGASVRNRAASWVK